MRRPNICGIIVDSRSFPAQTRADLADLFEVRIDLIGSTWQDLIPKINKPWIACNRTVGEGGNWRGSESDRIGELLTASELRADFIDIELQTTGLTSIVPMIKKRAKCLISFHDLEKTPPLNELKKIVRQQIAAGADICKVVTTANNMEDNINILELIKQFPKKNVLAFAMGTTGLTSRILGPLIGNGFAYASLELGKESAPGQITVSDLSNIYDMLGKES